MLWMEFHLKFRVRTIPKHSNSLNFCFRNGSIGVSDAIARKLQKKRRCQWSKIREIRKYAMKATRSLLDKRARAISNDSTHTMVALSAILWSAWPTPATIGNKNRVSPIIGSGKSMNIYEERSFLHMIATIVGVVSCVIKWYIHNQMCRAVGFDCFIAFSLSLSCKLSGSR